MAPEQKLNPIEITNKIFRDSETLYGLTEFSDTKAEESLNM